MRTFRKYLVSLASAALVLGSLAATGASVSAATVASGPFSDVTSSTQYANAINFLAGLGIINGTGNGVFQPTTPVTRAEMAKIVVLDAGKGAVANSLASMTPSFSDASSIPTWAWGYVNAAVAMGVIKGYPDGTFRANDNVTDAEALAMFTRALGDDWNVTGIWPNNYILAGYNLGIANGVASLSANVPALRGEIAEMAFNAALNANYTIVNSNGTDTLSSGGGIFTKNESTGGNGSVFPENIVGTVSNASANSITITPTGPGIGYVAGASSQNPVTYGYESSVTLLGATTLDGSLNGDSVTAVVDSNDLVSVIDVSSSTTTAADTLNSSGNETTNFSLPAGYSLPAGSGTLPTAASTVAATQAEAVGQANTSCDPSPGTYPYTNEPAGCNHNNTHNHVLVVQDSAGNYYLLMKDGKTVEYTGSTTISVNGTSMGKLAGQEEIVLVPGSTITATLSNGIASAITETETYGANLVTAVNPNTGTITFNEGGSPMFASASSATVTLNGQPSTLSAIQPNDDIVVEATPPVLTSGESLFGATLGGSTASNPIAVTSVAVTRNTVSGTITSSTTSTTPLAVNAYAYTSVTITLQPSSGNAVTLTTDGDQPTGDNTTLSAVNASVTLALDESGGILKVLSTSASSIPVAMLTGTGSNSSIVNGATQTYITLTGIAGSSTTTYNEQQTGGLSCFGATGSNSLPCVTVSGNATGYQNQPSTTTDGYSNFWALTTNASGQVTQATYLAPVNTTYTFDSNSQTDTLQVVSAGSSSVTIEALTPSGSVDQYFGNGANGTIGTHTVAGNGSYGFSNGYLTVTNGTAFSGVTGETYLGFGGLMASDQVKALYYASAPVTGGGNQNEYAIVDDYR